MLVNCSKPGVSEGASAVFGYTVGVGVNIVSRVALISPVNTAIFCAGTMFLSRVLESIQFLNLFNNHALGATHIGFSDEVLAALEPIPPSNWLAPFGALNRKISYKLNEKRVSFTWTDWKALKVAYPIFSLFLPLVYWGSCMGITNMVMKAFHCYTHITQIELLSSYLGTLFFLVHIAWKMIYHPVAQIKNGSLREIGEVSRSTNFTNQLFIFEKGSKEYPIRVIHNPEKRCLSHPLKCTSNKCSTKYEMIVAGEENAPFEITELVLSQLRDHNVRIFSKVDGMAAYQYFAQESA